MYPTSSGSLFTGAGMGGTTSMEGEGGLGMTEETGGDEGFDFEAEWYKFIFFLFVLFVTFCKL